ncbi:MAG: TolC family protein [Gemmatimonadaceae bacterium]|nr:TolC family protein [Gemmatimonadaceae bacterium]
MKGRFLLPLVLWAAAPARAEVLQLEDALRIAGDRSPTLAEARRSLEISRRELEAQRAALRSRFGLTVTPFEHSRDRTFNPLVSAYNTQEQSHAGARFSIRQSIEPTDGTLSLVQAFDWRDASSSFAGAGSRRTYSNALFLRYSQPLFTHNRTRLELRRLELGLENSHLQFVMQELQIESQVTRRFLDLYYQQRNLAIAVEELSNAGESLEIVRAKVEAGITAREELLQAGLTRANSRAAVENARLQSEEGLDEFRILLGLPLEMELRVEADVRKRLVEVDAKLAERHGLANRVEIRQRQIEVQNALDDLTRAGEQNEFKGSLDLSYGLTGTDPALAGLYDSPTRNQEVGIRFEVPIFDWGEREHRLAAARERVEARRLSAAEEERRILKEIRQACRALGNQAAQIEIAEKSVESARQTYRLNLERYRNGDLPSKDIAFYQNQLSREQLSEVRALIDYQLALLDLKVRALWDFAAGEPVINLESQ